MIYIGGIYEKNLDTGEVTKYYHTADGRRLAMRKGTTVSYFANDHLGSTAVVMNSAGDKTSETRYYPYGNIWTQTTSATPPTDKLFTGQRRYGAKSGVYHYGARFYSADIGRFLQADSIVPGAENPQALSRYSYVLNNPLMYNDPTGHKPERECTMSTCGNRPASRPKYIKPKFDPSLLPLPGGRAIAARRLAPKVVKYSPEAAKWVVVGVTTTYLAGDDAVEGVKGVPGVLPDVNVGLPNTWFSDGEDEAGFDHIGQVFEDKEKTKEVLEKMRDEGLSAEQAMEKIKELVEDDPGWVASPLGQGEHKGQGLRLNEADANGKITGDKQIRYHPGGGHHGPDPYIRVKSGAFERGGVRVDFPK